MRTRRPPRGGRPAPPHAGPARALSSHWRRRPPWLPPPASRRSRRRPPGPPPTTRRGPPRPPTPMRAPTTWASPPCRSATARWRCGIPPTPPGHRRHPLRHVLHPQLHPPGLRRPDPAGGQPTLRHRRPPRRAGRHRRALPAGAVLPRLRQLPPAVDLPHHPPRLVGLRGDLPRLPRAEPRQRARRPAGVQAPRHHDRGRGHRRGDGRRRPPPVASSRAGSTPRRCTRSATPPAAAPRCGCWSAPTSTP